MTIFEIVLLSFGIHFSFFCPSDYGRMFSYFRLELGFKGSSPFSKSVNEFLNRLNLSISLFKYYYPPLPTKRAHLRFYIHFLKWYWIKEFNNTGKNNE